MRRVMMKLLMAMILVGSFIAAQPAAAATPGERCFRETGFCISGAIRTYWERNGGLQVFGYPIRAQQVETNNDNWTGPTQWFERDRLEDHANERLGVLAGRLGVSYLEIQGRRWDSAPRVGRAEPGCRYFAPTGHTLCGAFLNYWERNGGLERFGYPITEPRLENLVDFSGTIQYFERRRMELHPELAGTPYEVLLGLLGSDLVEPYGCKPVIKDLRHTADAYPDLFRCPSPFPQIWANMVTQPYERGQMVWIEGINGGPGAIWVVFYDNSRQSLIWQQFYDSWTPNDPTSGGETPPPGLVEPIRGFGKVWRENPALRNTLGWAVRPELPDSGHLQYFQNGAWMLYRASVDRVFILRNDGRADDITRIP